MRVTLDEPFWYYFLIIYRFDTIFRIFFFTVDYGLSRLFRQVYRFHLFLYECILKLPFSLKRPPPPPPPPINPGYAPDGD